MLPLVKKTYQTLSEQNLLQKGAGVIVGVSGGPDSMALLHVLAALKEELHLTLTAVYVDHGLRPDETEQEKALVREQAGLLKAGFKAGTVAVKEYAWQHGMSIEHAARVLRYDFLDTVAEETAANRIAVAHTADDQAEEVLLRLIRGTGRKGLSGMNVVREGKIIRPFLTLPKTDLIEYLNHENIPFLEDSSNKERIYLRNRVRLDLIPHLAEHYNPNISTTLRQTAAILQDEELFLEDVVDEALKTIIIEEKNRSFDQHPECPEIILDVTAFNESPRAIQRRLLESVFWKMEQSPRFRQIEQVLHLAEAGENGTVVHLAGGLRATKEMTGIVFSYPQGMVPQQGNLIEKNQPLSQITVSEPGTITIPETGVEIRFEEMAHVPDMKKIINDQEDYLDLAQVSFPFIVRSPQPGDFFHPLGGPGRKKVADFLSDQKVPQEQRSQVPTLESSGSVAALLGLRIDHRARITKKTMRVLKVSMLESANSELNKIFHVT